MNREAKKCLKERKWRKAMIPNPAGNLIFVPAACHRITMGPSSHGASEYPESAFTLEPGP
jgi:hypothetical protein